jgi:alpha-tubulin suppressor-like RCC1 family protein
VTVAVLSGAAVVAYQSSIEREQPQVKQAEIEFEKPRKKSSAKEENRDLVSSQHLQVKKSWENPGVYAWGSNAGKVAGPDTDEPIIKTPRRISYFDGQILRDLKLDRNFGVAVTEHGDLVQWGLGFSKTSPSPVVTLKGKNIVKVTVSRDRVLALSSGGSVYSIPASISDQATGEKPLNSSWIPFWTSPSTVSYRTVRPANLGWGEKVVDISSGLEHCLILTSSGRVFSAAASTEGFPSKGQLGIPKLTWDTRPKGAYDQPHEITGLRGVKVTQIAAGDYHSLALDKDGRIFGFGDNSTGQLGTEPVVGSPTVDAPALFTLSKLYNGTGLLPRVTSIAAGGSNSYFTVDATRLGTQADAAVAPNLGSIIAEVWACGEGLYGSLGTGKWTHISSEPTKIKALSNLFEYNEVREQVVPIRLAHLSVGSTHACAVMDNMTYTAASKKTSNNDTNWGADVLWWGGNEHYQLGTGKRNNISTPTYIGPLDGGQGDAEKGRGGEIHRFQITPRTTVRLGEGGKGRKVSMEQRVECGRFVSGVYTGT